MNTLSSQSAEDLLYFARMFRATINQAANPVLHAHITQAIERGEREIGQDVPPRPSN